MPGVPLIAAFETEFHVTMPDYAARYGVPREWHDECGDRRYGFHGTSTGYVAERTAELLRRPKESLRVVSCHLGGSSSICAIDRDGASIPAWASRSSPAWRMPIAPVTWTPSPCST